MNAVVFYSNTGQSRAVAEYVSDRLGYLLIDIGRCFADEYENLVLVFPVHCQRIPEPVRALLKRVKAENMTVIATYGRIHHGNVLYEIQKKYKKNVVAGAYVPAKHAYIEDDGVFGSYEELEPLLNKIEDPSPITLPKLERNPFADFFPALRSRLGLKIHKGVACNGCNACTKACMFGAISAGVTNERCIRCLRCTEVCPRGALTLRISRPLKLYLSGKKKNDLIIYI